MASRQEDCMPKMSRNLSGQRNTEQNMYGPVVQPREATPRSPGDEMFVRTPRAV
jgi:hypothetical protein